MNTPASAEYVIACRPLANGHQPQVEIAVSEAGIPAHQAAAYAEFAPLIRRSHADLIAGLEELLAKLKSVEDPVYMQSMPVTEYYVKGSWDFAACRINLKTRLDIENKKLEAAAVAEVAAAPPASAVADPRTAALRAKITKMELEAARGTIRFEEIMDMRLRERVKDAYGTALIEEAFAISNQRRNMERFRELWNGRWMTHDGKRVMIYHFHAFEPPTDGTWRTPQALKHLGFYDPNERTISSSDFPPALPTTKKDWLIAFTKQTPRRMSVEEATAYLKAFEAANPPN